MDRRRVKMKTRHLLALFLVLLGNYTNALDVAYTVDGYNSKFWDLRPHEIVSLEKHRHRREAPTPSPAEATSFVPPNAAANSTPPTKPDDANRTTKQSTPYSNALVPKVTRVPLLGENGTGIHDDSTKLPKVSEPITPDDNLPNMFNETLETIKAEQNLTDLKYDSHNFYNSTFIGNVTFFKEHWANITKETPVVHTVLSNSHRRATTMNLMFDFPFYGHILHNVTVATGGFIYTGEHVHSWLAATQYIAPLMANIDTTLTNDSKVKSFYDDQKFTAMWENVTLREDITKKFTFAVTLYKNGDIWFAYKDIPIRIQDINDTEHPVKVGISDAYVTHKILYYVRHKTIYEYHRVSFRNHEIGNNTILKLVALPTCLQYNNCKDCVNHDTGFNCTWCEQLQACSSGTDRNKQDWIMRNCTPSQVASQEACRPPVNATATPESGANPFYSTDSDTNNYHKVVINTVPGETEKPQGLPKASASGSESQSARGGVGGVVAACFIVALVVTVASWIVYAFKNPHTRSGQLLIRYRPSQWSWRRGEARYTAATIHM